MTTTSQWDFDLSHSSINFWVRHLMVAKVHGRFGAWSGSLRFDEENPANASVEVQIDAASIDTKEETRDKHLRSADFLDVESHPKLLFKSTKIEKQDASRYRVHGDLTVRGHSEPVVLEVEYQGQVKDPWGNQRVVFSARSSVDRKKYGLNWNQALEAGGVLVGDKVEIDIEVQAVRKG